MLSGPRGSSLSDLVMLTVEWDVKISWGWVENLFVQCMFFPDELTWSSVLQNQHYATTLQGEKNSIFHGVCLLRIFFFLLEDQMIGLRVAGVVLCPAHSSAKIISRGCAV